MLNYKIEITVLLSGIILMSLEIISGRLLAPTYGDTIYLWGSIIGVFLLSLSLGYYLGGKLADKMSKPYVLSRILMAAGIFIFIIPFTYIYVINLFRDLPVIYATLASVILIFIAPNILLGMVSPFALKLKAKEVHKIGKLSGNLYSIATIGSVIGTFLTTFVFILILPTNTIIFFLSALSFLVSAIIFKRNIPFAVLAIVIIVLLLSISVKSYQEPENTYFSWQGSYLEEGINITLESLYGQVNVRDDEHIRTLSVNGGRMSQMDLRNESKTVEGWEYNDIMVEVPLILNPNIKSVLAMGLGGGVFINNLQRRYNVNIDAVEINEKVIEVAEKYFNVTPSDTLRIYADDARVFLQKTDKKYDFIDVDAFHYNETTGGHKIPFHLTTKEFFSLVKQHLNPDGIFVINIDGSDTKNMFCQSAFCKSEYKTIKSVFDSVFVFKYNVFVALKDRNYTDYQIRKLDKTGFLHHYPPIEVEITDESIILTDAFAPINPFK